MPTDLSLHSDCSFPATCRGLLAIGIDSVIASAIHESDSRIDEHGISNHEANKNLSTEHHLHVGTICTPSRDSIRALTVGSSAAEQLRIKPSE